MIRHILVAAAFALATVVPATAHHDGEQYRKGNISVSHAWTGSTAEMAHAIEVYMTIENKGPEALTLTGAEVDFAQPGVFQAQVVSADGALRTRETGAVEIAAGQSVTMQPGGLRIVFNDVQRRLFAGDHFHAHLQFAEIGEVEIEVEVEKIDEDGKPQSKDDELG
jgi:copper(I)-binding protein